MSLEIPWPKNTFVKNAQTENINVSFGSSEAPLAALVRDMSCNTPVRMDLPRHIARISIRAVLRWTAGPEPSRYGAKISSKSRQGDKCRFYKFPNIGGNARSRPCKASSSRLIMSRTPRGPGRPKLDHAHPRRRPLGGKTLRHLRPVSSPIPL
jgi:hypothetical protein